MKLKRPIVFLMLVLFLLSGCVKKEEITAGQMIMTQIEFTESYFSIMDEMSDTYSEYIAFNISEQKFKEGIKEYLERIKLEEKRYEEFNKKYVLASESADKDVLTLIALAEEARVCVKTILEKSVNKGRALPREELLELYVENSEKIESVMNDFKEILDRME